MLIRELANLNVLPSEYSEGAKEIIHEKDGTIIAILYENNSITTTDDITEEDAREQFKSLKLNEG